MSLACAIDQSESSLQLAVSAGAIFYGGSEAGNWSYLHPNMAAITTQATKRPLGVLDPLIHIDDLMQNRRNTAIANAPYLTG